MNTDEIKQKIKDFLKNHKLTVIATVDTEKNKPQNAVIAFAENENLELIFGTANTSRKYKNIQTNPNVSFVIGWDPTQGTVQYEGIARELSVGDKKKYGEILGAKNPHAVKFIDREDQRYFLVKPTWVRILDMSKKPDEKHEITL